MIDDIVFDIEMVFEIEEGQPGGLMRSYSMDGSSFDVKNSEKSVIIIQ